MSDLNRRFDRAFVPLQRAVEAGRIPGGVLGVVEQGGGRLSRAIGSAQRIPSERPMLEDTWFDLASLTKVIFTTPRILALAEAGTIELDAPLTTALPDLRQYDAGAWERRDPDTVYQWLDYYREGGITGLVARLHGGGRRGRL